MVDDKIYSVNCKKGIHNLKSKKTLCLIILVTLTLSCKDLLYKSDPDFQNDVINGPENLEFDPNKLPILDHTTEKELLEMYPRPSYIRTYKKPITNQIMGKKTIFDKVYNYTRYKKEILKPPLKGYIGKDYLYFYVFFKEGIAKQYIIHHQIKEKINDFYVWVPGEYSNIPGRDRYRFDEKAWPTATIAGECYWAQRRDRNAYFHGNYNFDCPYWDPVPVFEDTFLLRLKNIIFQ